MKAKIKWHFKYTRVHSLHRLKYLFVFYYEEGITHKEQTNHLFVSGHRYAYNATKNMTKFDSVSVGLL